MSDIFGGFCSLGGSGKERRDSMILDQHGDPIPCIYVRRAIGFHGGTLPDYAEQEPCSGVTQPKVDISVQDDNDILIMRRRGQE